MLAPKLLTYVLGLCLLFSAALSTAASTPQNSSDTPEAMSQWQPTKIEKVIGALRNGETIEIVLRDYEDFLKNNKDLSKVTLYVDGIKILEGARLIGDGKLAFDFENSKVSKETWKKLSRCITTKDSFFSPVFKVSLRHDKKIIATSEEEHSLSYISPVIFWIFIVLYAALVVVFLYLAKVSMIIRDPCPDVKISIDKPFSLGKSQLAFWFLLVLPSFFFIWYITGSTDSLTGSTPALLGISGLTTLISGYVDKTKIDKFGAELTDQSNKLREISEQLKVAEKNKEKATLKADQAAVQDRLEKLKTQRLSEEMLKSMGFIKDILRDNNGTNLHRLQCVIWSLVMGFIFVYTTICTLTMPQFSTALLALMGISNGTYVALKVPEKQGKALG